MGVVYGLLAAVFWGTADFLARLASERVGSLRALFYMQLVSLGLVSLMLGVPAARPPWPSNSALLIAAGIGALNVVGGALLYRALEVGTVSMVSPISSTFAAISAVLAITVAAERPTGMQLAGLSLCAVGVVAVAMAPQSNQASPSTRGLGMACGAALCWGVSFFALRYVVADLGAVFTVWISRVISVAAVGLWAKARRRSLALPRGAGWHVVGIAVFDSAAFIAYNLGVATHLTAVVSILSSLFAAVTVLWALFVLGERLGRRQWAAVAVILSGVALVSSAG